ncbi:hypothetical protein QR98_0019020, partial [Sarcoptes scabiei]
MSSNQENKKIKLIDLPLYPSCCEKSTNQNKEEPANLIQPYVSEAREKTVKLIDPYVGHYMKRFGEILTTSKDHSLVLLQTIRDDENQAARATFITSAAFLGYLIGRRGFFRKSLFAVVAAGSAAAICQPKLAKDYAEVAYEITAKK